MTAKFLSDAKATAANMDKAAAQQVAEAITDGPEQSFWATFLSWLSIIPTPIWAATLSVAAIITAAVFGARWQRRTARETLTFNTIERQLWDGDYIATRATFIAVRDGKAPDELRQLASKENAKTPEAAAVRTILNNYELLSLGMMTQVLDAEIYKRYFRKTFVTDFETSKPFIDAVKTRSPRAYKEYTAMYEKWRENGSGSN